MNKHIFLFLSFLISVGFFSCSMLSIPSWQNWSPGSGKQLAIAETGIVRVDKNADWDSVETETRRLLPLLLAEAGYKQTVPETDLPEQLPAYKVDVVLIEREYMENWKTRRSLSAEIAIWKNDESGKAGEKVLLAAGKALLLGTKSLSSSKTLHNLLKLALSNALKALPKK